MAGRHSVFEGLISKRAAVVVFNLLMLGYFWVTNRLHNDVESVIGIIAAFILMNVVIWISNKNFRDWK